MKKIIYLSIAFAVIFTFMATASAATEDIWQIGDFDLSRSELKGSGLTNTHELDFSVGTHVASDFPGTLYHLTPSPFDDRGVQKVNILFTLDKAYEDVVLEYGRAGDETDEITLDGEHLATITGIENSWEGSPYSIPIGYLAEGDYVITIEVTAGGVGDDAHVIDALKLTGTDNDLDDDGVVNNEDMCPGTDIDVLVKDLGTNRWIWNGEDWEKGTIPGKDKAKGPDFTVTMEDTQGCGCFQILEYLHENYPEEYGKMKGHYKFGCSKSVIEDFMRLADEQPSLTGQWLLSVNSGAYMHDMFILTQNPDGTITGNGGYPSGSGPVYPYPYNWTLTGQLTGDAITMTISYENSYTATITGTVVPDWDSMSGGAGTGGVVNWSATRI